MGFFWGLWDFFGIYAIDRTFIEFEEFIKIYWDFYILYGVRESSFPYWILTFNSLDTKKQKQKKKKREKKRNE